MKITAKQKIMGLCLMMGAVADFGRQPNEDGTPEEEELLFKLSVLGCGMGQMLLAHAQKAEATAQDQGQSTVTE